MGWLRNLPAFDDVVYTFPDGQRRRLPPDVYRDSYRRSNLHFRRYQASVVVGPMLLAAAATALLHRRIRRR